MKFLDVTLSSPEENLACDEALLEACEEGGDEVLRVWESGTYFVVLGYGNRIASEVNVAECRAAGIPILRRPSGGGAVLQGPGCLNYSLTLRIATHQQLQTIPATNQFIMRRHQQALQESLGKNVAVMGDTDLACDNLKFSGNAQRRRRNSILFHGTFLHSFDLPAITRFLKSPSREPPYRAGRSHAGFVKNIPLAAVLIKKALSEIWNADAEGFEIPRRRILELVDDRYGKPDWNEKF